MKTTPEPPTGSSGSSQSDLFQGDGSTGDPSPTSGPATSRASFSTTSSRGSEGGPLPASLLASLPTGPSGPPLALVSLLVRRDGDKVPTIHGICGPTSFGCSTPAGPLAAWENRLRARLAMIGSTESPLIWQAGVTPAERSISRLRPWTPRRSDNDSTGQPSAFWPIPQASGADAGSSSRSGDRKGELLLQGMMRENTPPDASAWSTARASDGEKGSTNRRPWAAPRAGDWRSGSSQVGAADLRAGGAMLPEQMTEAVTAPGGPAPTGSPATTGRPAGSPTPLHPCWLQGFPAVWLLGAASVTPSSPRSRAKSSPPSSKRKADPD